MNLPIKELINPLPGYKILHVSSYRDEIIRDLQDVLEEVGGKLSLAFYELQGDSRPREQFVKSYNDIFRALPRDHDIVILHDVFVKHQNKEELLKATYETLANAAYIIILEPKGNMDLLEVKDILTNSEFRAPNEIDLLSDYDLVIAKKMHMWGNGL
jgi:hypothetical protein